MDKQKIRNWLDGWIEVAHELSNTEQGRGACTLTLPSDIADVLAQNEIIEAIDNHYTYKAKHGDVVVEAVVPYFWSSTMSIKVTKVTI